jgi:hypothetical protein
MDHLQKSWSDPKGSRAQGFEGSSEMPNIFVWFQIQPKLFSVCLKICLFGKTIEPFSPTQFEKNQKLRIPYVEDSPQLDFDGLSRVAEGSFDH